MGPEFLPKLPLSAYLGHDVNLPELDLNYYQSGLPDPLAGADNTPGQRKLPNWGLYPNLLAQRNPYGGHQLGRVPNYAASWPSIPSDAELQDEAINLGQTAKLIAEQKKLEPERKGTLPRPGLAGLALLADLLLGKGRNQIFANFLGGYSQGAEYYNNEALEKYRREHKKYQDQIDDLNRRRTKQFNEQEGRRKSEMELQALTFNNMVEEAKDATKTAQERLDKLASYRDSLPFGSEQGDILNDLISKLTHDVKAEKNINTERNLIRVAVPNATPEQVEQLADIVRLFDPEFQSRFRDRVASYIQGGNLPGQFGGFMPASKLLGLASLIKAQIANLQTKAKREGNSLSDYDFKRLISLNRVLQGLMNDDYEQDFSFTRNLRIPTLEQ